MDDRTEKWFNLAKWDHRDGIRTWGLELTFLWIISLFRVWRVNAFSGYSSSFHPAIPLFISYSSLPFLTVYNLPETYCRVLSEIVWRFLSISIVWLGTVLMFEWRLRCVVLWSNFSCLLFSVSLFILFNM